MAPLQCFIGGGSARWVQWGEEGWGGGVAASGHRQEAQARQHICAAGFLCVATPPSELGDREGPWRGKTQDDRKSAPPKNKKNKNTLSSLSLPLESRTALSHRAHRHSHVTRQTRQPDIYSPRPPRYPPPLPLSPPTPTTLVLLNLAV